MTLAMLNEWFESMARPGSESPLRLPVTLRRVSDGALRRVEVHVASLFTVHPEFRIVPHE